LGPTAVVAQHTPAYRDEHLTLDFDQQSAVLDTQRMSLTRKEYALLALLVRHAGEIIPREALLMQVWGYGAEIRTRTLDVHVRRLRKKLGSYADRYIETIFGIGYRFQPYHAPRFFHSTAGKAVVAIGA
jgi:DNA-binding response OmpR family regulator